MNTEPRIVRAKQKCIAARHAVASFLTMEGSMQKIVALPDLAVKIAEINLGPYHIVSFTVFSIEAFDDEDSPMECDVSWVAVGGDDAPRMRGKVKVVLYESGEVEFDDVKITSWGTCPNGRPPGFQNITANEVREAVDSTHTTKLPFPIKTVIVEGREVQEYEIPEDEKEKVLNDLCPYAPPPSMTAKMRDMHTDKTFVVSQFRVTYEMGTNFIVSPYYDDGGGTIIDWFPADGKD